MDQVSESRIRRHQRFAGSINLLDGLPGDLNRGALLAPAFIRGIDAKRRLIEQNGGAITAEQVADIIGISQRAVEKRRQSGKLIAILDGRQRHRYPAWQFEKSGTLPGLPDVLAILAPHDEWMKTIFFVSKNPRLGEHTPVESLLAGKLKEVMDAAAVYTEHGSV